MDNVKRLHYLNKMISKYTKNRKEGAEPSQRTYGWMDEYSEIKEKNRQSWEKYNDECGGDYEHNATDLLA